MSKLTKDEVLHIAKLAQLNLDDGQIKKFLPQLTSVVDFISQLNEVDTQGVEPTAQVTGLMNVFREDKVIPRVLFRMRKRREGQISSTTDTLKSGQFWKKEATNN